MNSRSLLWIGAISLVFVGLMAYENTAVADSHKVVAATAAAQTEHYDGYAAALINFRMIASAISPGRARIRDAARELNGRSITATRFWTVADDVRRNHDAVTRVPRSETAALLSAGKMAAVLASWLGAGD